ncbi:zinc finger protein 569-like [Zophobas morio]|uniref:zinc finger protein 569-like n=1 Tax=Zophobas morio TaxID=2755281 RepID=UPI00308318A0
MDNTSSYAKAVKEAILSDCCVICGKDHNIKNCDYIKISKHVPDKPMPTKAKLTLPDFLDVQLLSDGTYSTIVKAPIAKGTQFGPFQAEKTPTLEPSVLFPLKIFSLDENENEEYFLDNSNEEKCSWLMYVGAAECLEEQNIICYQEKEDIYYVTIKDINVGDVLKVWYSPYYALKMNKSILQSKPDVDDAVNYVDVNSLIKKQQKIMERKVWTCKFCSHIENNIVSFAKHILKHYTAQHKNMCEMCKKAFGSKKNLKNHMKFVHKVVFATTAPKPPKTVDAVAKTQCKDVALGGPLLNDIFTDSSDLQQSDLNQFDLNIDNQNLLLDNDNLTVENLLNENVKDLDHFNFEIDDSQKQFVCDICLKQFTKVKLLIIHLRHHTGDFMCYKCSKIFCRKENLLTHICNINAQQRCNLCDKSFTQKKYLSRHLQAIHHKKFHCVSCNKSYHSNKELLEHNCSKVPVADKEKFMCSICNKHFYRERYLKKHLQTHGPRTKTTKTVNVTCDVCGLHFQSRNSYYLHKKKHEEPSYSCETCNKKFYRQDILNEHVLIHMESDQFECNTCQKKFKSKKVLRNHVKSHDSLNSVKCSICDITFKSRPSLNKHVRNFHSGSSTIEYYYCPVCNKSIKLKSSVLRHLRKVHPDVSSIDVNCIKPKIVSNSDLIRINKRNPVSSKNRSKKKINVNVECNNLQSELDDQINNLLNSAENNSAIQKHAVDSLVQELDIDRKKEQKQAREVCLSIPDLTDNYQEITLDKNAYILDNGTIVQPQGDSDNVIIYVLDQTY